jgi:hypothetical protein
VYMHAKFEDFILHRFLQINTSSFEGAGFLVLGGGQTGTIVDLTWTREERRGKRGAERWPAPLFDVEGERERGGGPA